MISAPLPPREELRLRALDRLEILDTAPEQRFDRLTDLASIALGVPIALVTLVDRDRQWFKSRVGLGATETNRDVSFCAHAILVDPPGLFIVEDTALDVRFADNPLVTGNPGIRFYAGQVLRDPDGHALGTLCVIDRTPRTLDADQRRALAHLASLAEQELNRRSEMELLVDLDVGERKKALILDALGEGVILQDVDGAIVEWNPAAERLLGLCGDELAGRRSTDPRWGAVHADGSAWPAETHPPIEVLRTGRPITDVVMGVHRPHGDRVWLRLSSQPIVDRPSGARQVLTVFANVTTEVEERAREHELEQALARSEQVSRVSLDSLEQGVILADVDGVIHRINPAAERLLGHTAAELTALWLGGNWLIFDEAGVPLPRHRHPLVRVAETGRAIIGETVGWRRPDGTRILLRLSCVPNADGDERLVITFTDITDDRLAQRVLDATLDTAPVGLAILDTDRSILRCNSTFAEQAGRPVEELVGVDVVSLIHFDHRPDASAVGNHLRSGARSNAELEQCVVRPDGTEIWVNTHLAVIPDPDRPLAIAATFDVTEQRRLLLELTRFGYMFEHANDIIIIIDGDGQVRYASPSSERILGYPRGFEHPGVLGLVHPDDVAAAAEQLAQLVAGTRGTEPFTARIRTYSGEWRHIEFVAVNLLDEPAVAGIVITARDATDRVRLTEQLAHQAKHDPLTDLPNRQLLDERIVEALARADRTGTKLALCYIDLDGFKAVNDTFGHAAGDGLLIRVADCLRRSVRAGDMGARLGGDEFVLLLDPIGRPDDAAEVITRVRRQLLAINDPASPLQFGASIGVALSEPLDTPSALLKRADDALYRAKVTHDSTISVASGHADFDAAQLRRALPLTTH
ncbi:MAG: hypothetical protein JWN62_811 [Acidimicrobiales bacterium]|nr:hypothetical protein [Acidimicrobiales bacterium]